MRRVIIVHRWDGNPKGDWYPWLKKELEKIGFKVIIPAMPNSSEPQIEEWVSHLQKTVGKLDEETLFVGHSIGCQAIMRSLEKLPRHTKVTGCVFVAGFFDLIIHSPEELKIAHPWTNTKINFLRILE